MTTNSSPSSEISDIEMVACMCFLGYQQHQLMVGLKKHERYLLPEDYTELMRVFTVSYGTLTEIEQRYLEVLNGKGN